MMLFIIIFSQVSYAGNTAQIEKLSQLVADFEDPTAMFLLAKEYEKRNTATDLKYAFSWYRRAATFGNNKSDLKIAFMYKNGIGVTKNSQMAIEFFHKAAINGYGGSPRAQFQLGKLYYKGIGTEQDYGKAFNWYGKAADQYYYKAFYPLGLMYYEGRGTKKNIKQAKKWLKQAVEVSDGLAKLLLSKIEKKEEGPGPSESEIAESEYEKETEEVRVIKVAAENGDKQAQYKLGIYYYEGIHGLTKDLNKAFYNFSRSALKNHGIAQYLLGVMYLEGTGVKKDIDESRRWLKKAEQANITDAKELLASKAFTNGFHVESIENKKPIVGDFRKAANQGDTHAQYRLGMLLYRGTENVQKNTERALFWLKKAANKDHSTAQMTLANLYQSGEAIKRNTSIAKHWYNKAAMLGIADAQFNLASIMLADNEDVSAIKWLDSAAEQGHIAATNVLVYLHLQKKLVGIDSSKIDKWIEKAAGNKNLEAQYLLGKRFKNGPSTDVNRRMALHWFKKAATRDHAGAQYSLGQYLKKGLGVDKDLTSAFDWYMKAAKQGFVDAQYALGEMYNTGKGVPRNRPKAKKWYRLAARQGHYKASIKARSL